MKTTISASPDDWAKGFVDLSADSLRYEKIDDNPYEAAALVAELIPFQARVLDVGCGTGSTSIVIHKLRGASVIGVEPDEQRAQFAQQRGLEVFRGYLTDDITSLYGLFDAVVFADVLEHLPNPSTLLQIGSRCLKPGGVVVMSIPNVAHWSVRWNLLWGRFDYEKYGLLDATHLRWFTTASVSRWLENNGLVIDCIKHSAGTSLPVYGQLRPWRWIPRKKRNLIIQKMVKLWPNLFGCQHIVRARPSAFARQHDVS